MLRTILIVCVFTSTITSNTLYNNNPFLANGKYNFVFVKIIAKLLCRYIWLHFAKRSIANRKENVRNKIIRHIVKESRIHPIVNASIVIHSPFVNIKIPPL